MILACPDCQARFAVPDHLIPAGGRTVRCGKCAHEWHVDSVAAPAPEPVVQQVEAAIADAAYAKLEAALATPETRPVTGSNLPAIKRSGWNEKPFRIAVPVLAALWLIAAFIAYFPSWSKAPVIGGIYRAMGVRPLQGLVFADVHMEREMDGGITRYILTGSVRNHTSELRVVPTVRVQLKDKDNETIWGRNYPVNVELQAGDVYPFRISNVETAFGKNVTGIVVDMGNSLQLLVR